MERILVVDDLPYNRDLLETELQKLGFEIITAETGDEALKQVHDQAPDLMLLDLSLPGLDGLEVLRQLREEPQYVRLPIILVTAKKNPEDRIEGLDAGADDYITKPFSIDEVAARIRVQLRIVRLEKQIIDHERSLAQLTGIGQTLVTLAHYINNSTQAISGMAQLCQADPDNTNQRDGLVRTALDQSVRITTVLEALQTMVDRMEVRAADYAGDPDRMLDIEEELQRRLGEG